MRISCFLNSMQKYIENGACQKAFISVYFTFIIVHCTFILWMKISKKTTLQET